MEIQREKPLLSNSAERNRSGPYEESAPPRLHNPNYLGSFRKQVIWFTTESFKDDQKEPGLLAKPDLRPSSNRATLPSCLGGVPLWSWGLEGLRYKAP